MSSEPKHRTFIVPAPGGRLHRARCKSCGWSASAAHVYWVAKELAEAHAEAMRLGIER